MIKKRHVLSKKEVKKVIDKISEVLDIDRGYLVQKKVEVAELKDGGKLYLLEGEPIAIEIEVNGTSIVIPTLWSLAKLNMKAKLPKVVVDMGAVPHICNGADVMRPGIRNIVGTFNKDSLTIVVDEKFMKPLAVCKALFSSEEIIGMKKGKVLKNIHYVSDNYWKLCENLSKVKR